LIKKVTEFRKVGRVRGENLYPIKKGLVLFANPVIFLVELRGVEPLTS